METGLNHLKNPIYGNRGNPDPSSSQPDRKDQASRNTQLDGSSFARQEAEGDYPDGPKHRPALVDAAAGVICASHEEVMTNYSGRQEKESRPESRLVVDLKSPGNSRPRERRLSNKEQIDQSGGNESGQEEQTEGIIEESDDYKDLGENLSQIPQFVKDLRQRYQNVMLKSNTPGLQIQSEELDLGFYNSRYNEELSLNESIKRGLQMSNVNHRYKIR